MKPIQLTACVWQLFQKLFSFYSGCAMQRLFVEHTVSFIGQALNLKAWWGVY